MRLIFPRLLSVCVVAALALTDPRAHAAAPAAPGKPGASPFQPAITALLKEYQAAAATPAAVPPAAKGEGKGEKPAGPQLREKCDYFAGGKPAGVTAEAVVAALEKPVSTDPRAEAYVKWQLLSALDGRFPEELKARVINVYRRAPVPTNHPGADRTMLQRQLQRMGISKADAEPDINKELGDAIARYRLQIEPILEYRDELYARLPPGVETLAAGLEDVYVRVSHGAPANEFWKNVSSGIRSWALVSSDAQKMRELAGAVGKLYAFVKDDHNHPYYRVMWAKEDKFTGLKWVGESTIQNDKSMGELADWLDEHARNPGGGGLNFKDSEDSKKKGK